MRYEHTMEFRALVLDLLMEILIKIHAGPRWGASESEVLELTKKTHEFSLECRRFAGKDKKVKP